MTTGLLFALAASFAWAGLDTTRKVLVRDLEPVAAAAWLAVLNTPIFLVWALATGERGPTPAYWFPGGVALLLQVVANVMFLRALVLSPLSLTIPFLSLTPVFTSLLSLVLLGEELSAAQWGGIVLVVTGALTLHGGVGSLLAGLRRERGSVLMIGVALIWSVTGPLSKLALQHASVPWHATIQTAGVAVALVTALLVRGGPRRLRVVASARRWLGASAVFSLVAFTCELFAIRLIFVGLVEALKRAIGMTSSVVLGRALFHEPITRSKAIAVLLMIAGSALLLL
ncbi:MAG: DMT family transporter [Planctomycetota bacterium]|nr:DMT family transporter [Planctomycetota bacterium]